MRTLVRGDGSAARKETPIPPPPSRYLCVFIVTSSGLEGAAGRRGGGWGAGANSGPGCEPGSGSGDREAFACACANLSPTLPPPLQTGLQRAPAVGLCARVLFSFLPCPWQRRRVCWLRSPLVVGLVGGVFLPGLTFGAWTCGSVKREDQPLSAWELRCLPRLCRFRPGLIRWRLLICCL